MLSKICSANIGLVPINARKRSWIAKDDCVGLDTHSVAIDLELLP